MEQGDSLVTGIYDVMLALPLMTFEHGVLAAVSGGADSVAMLHLLADSCPAEGKLAVAHVNHGLRGADSDADAEFVKSLAEEYQLRYFEHRLQSLRRRGIRSEGGTLEVNRTLCENSARNLRYDFLVQQAERIGFRYLATAHTLDDQTETVVHRLLRGTGLSGLAGMASARMITPAVTLLRPMLHVRRTTILAYLKSLGKTFREDKTNVENQFTRNRIRNRLLPMLRKEFNPQIDEALCRLATLATENESVLSELLDGFINSAILEQSPSRVVLDVLPLQHFSSSVLREMLIRVWKQQNFPMREMDYAQWSALAQLFQTQLSRTSGKRLDFPGGISAQRTQDRFVMTTIVDYSR